MAQESRRRDKLTVAMDDDLLDALEDAAGTRCTYREHDHAIVAVGGSERSRSGRGGGKSKQRMWTLGDRVRVRAERIDPMRHRVEFALLD